MPKSFVNRTLKKSKSRVNSVRNNLESSVRNVWSYQMDQKPNFSRQLIYIAELVPVMNMHEIIATGTNKSINQSTNPIQTRNASECCLNWILVLYLKRSDYHLYILFSVYCITKSLLWCLHLKVFQNQTHNWQNKSWG